MPTNQQRREAERRRLQRQLEQRRAKEASRKRATLIGSIIGTLVVIVAVVIIVVVATSGGSSKKPKAGAKTTPPAPSPTATTSTTAAAPPAAAPIPTTACAAPSKGASVTFDGLTVSNATDVKHEPKVTGKSATDPAKLACKDLVIGKGKAAGPNASVTAQYVGIVYKTGKVFQSSWGSGQQPTFTLKSGEGGVIDGFNQGIGGAGKVTPMHVGGRRIIVMPAALAYGANSPDPSIPANASLVFVVDLQKVG